MLAPAIKWSGSKRSQAKDILKHFPKEIDTYYEPFCGGASVLGSLLQSDIKVKQYICSDLNADLIALWNCIKDNPEEVALHYDTLWQELNSYTDLDDKRAYFNEVRERYNTAHSPLDFMFIMRTTTNGMPRYNAKGEFNNSFHITRNGINPKSLRKILSEWSVLLNTHEVEFECHCYTEVHSEKLDFLYLDPPYANTKGMYFNHFDTESFFTWLENCSSSYALSYDGKCAGIDNTYAVPPTLYTRHQYLKSGNSSFRRVIGNKTNSMVFESLYVK